MAKTVRKIIKKVTNYLRAAITEELRVMDAFYAQFD